MHGNLDGSVLDYKHSIHSTDPNTSLCTSICLEAFQISNTVVTWSQADACRHVSHTDYIHEGLSNPKHEEEDCLSCRAQMINLEQQLYTTGDPENNSNGTGDLYTQPWMDE